ncbi:Hypothetical protein SRAE_1000148900 [Strongyloides ratti]|uniref:Uncharacterized protein n=1 Tax=Strongyloides ratti TaxID=34506 RepID=A0A090L0P2_STRRB|nr:Hypothetical protein SRAE_1000148900 [Strongyloides ratti]CEF63226.1 Hypothetical protein SRAE_1000148900 [Strongyloides ratti]
MELILLIICFLVTIIVLSLFLGFIVFSKSRAFRNEYRPHERACQKMSSLKNTKVPSSDDVEVARDNSSCQNPPLECIKVESLEHIEKVKSSNEPVDISLLESLDILHLGNLDTLKMHRSYSDQCFHISSYLMNFEFQDDIQHHLSSTRKNPLSQPSTRGKPKLRRFNTFGNSSIDFQSSFIKEFEADIQTRLCSTRRSSASSIPQYD